MFWFPKKRLIKFKKGVLLKRLKLTSSIKENIEKEVNRSNCDKKYSKMLLRICLFRCITVKFQISVYLRNFNKTTGKGECKSCNKQVKWSAYTVASHKRVSCKSATREEKQIFALQGHKYDFDLQDSSLDQPTQSPNTENDSTQDLEVYDNFEIFKSEPEFNPIFVRTSELLNDIIPEPCENGSSAQQAELLTSGTDQPRGKRFKRET